MQLHPKKKFSAMAISSSKVNFLLKIRKWEMNPHLICNEIPFRIF